MSFPKFNPNTRKVTVGGSELVLAALPAGLMIRDVLPMFEKFRNGDISNLYDETPTLTAIIAESVTRGGTPTTPEEVAAECDFSTILDIFLEVVKTNGMKRVDQGEAQAQNP